MVSFSIEILKKIENQYVSEIANTFGKNLVFSFVFGGFAKGYANSKHDIDFFICVKKKNDAELRQFHKWAKALHEDLALPIDKEYPFELTTLEELNQTLYLASRIKPSLTVETIKEYDAYVYGDIFSGEKKLKQGNINLLNRYTKSCRRLRKAWTTHLINQLRLNKIDYADEDMTLLFEKHVTYLKKNAEPQVV